ncbi:MAG: DNA polymerase III subunit alpha [Firmicutes bacterium]|nr:DNA polymerase III subunit alpha [Bacillota bacterium]
MTEFVHLHVHSPYSFLDGGSSLDRLVQQAAALGMPALAVTDHNNLSAIPDLHRLAREAGVLPITGCEVDVEAAGPEQNASEQTTQEQNARKRNSQAQNALRSRRPSFLGGSGHDLPPRTYHLTLLATGPEGYRSLCRLLSRAHLDHPRGAPLVTWENLAAHKEGLIALSGCRRGEIPTLVRQRRFTAARAVAEKYRALFGPENFFIELIHELVPGNLHQIELLVELAEATGLPYVASNNVHYAEKADFAVHDILTCVRTLTTLEDVHRERRLNAENYLKSPDAMAALFARWPQAVANSVAIAARCRPALDAHEPLFPAFTPPGGIPAPQYLRDLTFAGARRRYGRVTPAIQARLENELHVIHALGFDEYFLAVWDIARYAREKGIRFAGRGSAADSAVAYCLGLTGVDAIGRGLMFERFLSLERAQKPDIDLDFDARRRDEVAAYVYQRYGAEHVASVATYNTFQARSAVRDLGKAMGFTEEEIGRLAKRLPHAPADAIADVIQRLPELRKSGLDFSRYAHLFQLAAAVAGFPRHYGTHLGGLVISRRPITDIAPLQWAAKGVAIVQYDKDQVEELGLIKLDLLSLRMLSAVADAETLLAPQPEGAALGALMAPAVVQGREAPGSFDTLPAEDPETYAMIRRGETIGVFQLESPAQRALQSRLGADHFEDLVASVALIRPGPIEGNMVEPFIARRRGLQEITYLHPQLRPILEKTYGVVLFQEQVIQIATVIAGFTPGEADRLRRVMTHARSRRDMEEIGREFVARARQRGVEKEVAETIFSYIQGYAGYGFCEAHAAAFADTAYKTAYLARHYPAHFFAALLSNQPMGFYPASTLLVEARRRGVAILPPDVNKSEAEFSVERLEALPVPSPGERPPTQAPPAQSPRLAASSARWAIRVGLRPVRALEEKHLQALLAQRRQRRFTDLYDFCQRLPLPRDVAENLVFAGALASLEPNRRRALWTLARLLGSSRPPEPSPQQLSLALPWEAGRLAAAPSALQDFSALEKMQQELFALGFSVEHHPLEFWRPHLRRLGVKSSREVQAAQPGSVVQVAGVAIRPHRPPTKSGRIVVFLSLEDETGLVDVTVFPQVYEKYGQILFTEPLLWIRGRLEQRGQGQAVLAQQIAPLQEFLAAAGNSIASGAMNRPGPRRKGKG